MELPIPAWFKYRQCEAQAAGENCYRITAPQMEPVYLRIRQTPTGWQASLSQSADGPDSLASAPNLPDEREAWTTAFELLRVGAIV